jgi:hypothetical protein
VDKAGNSDIPFITRIFLLVLSIGIGIVVEIGSELIHSIYTGRRFDITQGSIISMVVIAIPFVLLAVIGVRSIVTWSAGIILTLLFWGFALFDALSHWGSGRGVNIGLGLAFYLSPIIISVVCVVIGWRMESRDLHYV